MSCDRSPGALDRAVRHRKGWRPCPSAKKSLRGTAAPGVTRGGRIRPRPHRSGLFTPRSSGEPVADRARALRDADPGEQFAVLGPEEDVLLLVKNASSYQTTPKATVPPPAGERSTQVAFQSYGLSGRAASISSEARRAAMQRASAASSGSLNSHSDMAIVCRPPLRVGSDSPSRTSSRVGAEVSVVEDMASLPSSRCDVRSAPP